MCEIEVKIMHINFECYLDIAAEIPRGQTARACADRHIKTLQPRFGTPAPESRKAFVSEGRFFKLILFVFCISSKPDFTKPMSILILKIRLAKVSFF